MNTNNKKGLSTDVTHAEIIAMLNRVEITKCVKGYETCCTITEGGVSYDMALTAYKKSTGYGVLKLTPENDASPVLELHIGELTCKEIKKLLEPHVAARIEEIKRKAEEAKKEFEAAKAIFTEAAIAKWRDEYPGETDLERVYAMICDNVSDVSECGHNIHMTMRGEGLYLYSDATSVHLYDKDIYNDTPAYAEVTYGGRVKNRFETVSLCRVVLSQEDHDKIYVAIRSFWNKKQEEKLRRERTERERREAETREKQKRRKAEAIQFIKGDKGTAGSSCIVPSLRCLAEIIDEGEYSVQCGSYILSQDIGYPGDGEPPIVSLSGDFALASEELDEAGPTKGYTADSESDTDILVDFQSRQNTIVEVRADRFIDTNGWQYALLDSTTHERVTNLPDLIATWNKEHNNN